MGVKEFHSESVFFMKCYGGRGLSVFVLFSPEFQGLVGVVGLRNLMICQGVDMTIRKKIVPASRMAPCRGITQQWSADLSLVGIFKDNCPA